MTVTPIRPDLAHDDHTDGVPAVTVAVRAGITYRQLDYWTRAGRIHPIEDNPGTGNIRRYPAHEVAVATLMGRLTRAGLNPNPAEQAARELLTTGTHHLAGIRLDLPEHL